MSYRHPSRGSVRSRVHPHEEERRNYQFPARASGGHVEALSVTCDEVTGLCSNDLSYPFPGVCIRDFFLNFKLTGCNKTFLQHFIFYRAPSMVVRGVAVNTSQAD